MHEVSELILTTLANGLKRRAVTSCSRWAQTYRIMGKPIPGPYNFRFHPWTREMHDSQAVFNWGQKGAQLGFTEMALNHAFYSIDVRRVDCLYILPARTPDASDFSSSRFDAALELSPHLAQLFSDVKNIGHKRAGSTNLYIRGSKSRAGLKSIPVGRIYLDEMDEMVQANIPLALERAAGQMDYQVWGLSTPTIPNKGINVKYKQSTEEHFFFPCPKCSRNTELLFPECLVIVGDNPDDPRIGESHLVCKECRNKLEHTAKPDFLALGSWVASKPTATERGFHVNQLYSSSSQATPANIAKTYLTSLTSKPAEQEFYNSKLGLPHIVDGAQLNDTCIDEQLRPYRNCDPPQPNRLRTMGIDVGKWLHVEIAEWTFPNSHDASSTVDINAKAQCRVVHSTKVPNFEDLDQLMRDWQIRHAIIDANPERRKAFEFAQRFPGFVKLCFYGKGLSGKQLTIDEKEVKIAVDRTSWLDVALGRFNKKSILLPTDITNEFRQHLKALVRVYGTDEFGNAVAKYESTGDDHYGHARCYAEIGLPFAVALGTNTDIHGLL